MLAGDGISTEARRMTDEDTPTRLCPTCGGTGVDAKALRKKRNSPRIARAQFDPPPCPDCLGTGEVEDAAE